MTDRGRVQVRPSGLSRKSRRPRFLQHWPRASAPPAGSYPTSCLEPEMAARGRARALLEADATLTGLQSEEGTKTVLGVTSKQNVSLTLMQRECT